MARNRKAAETRGRRAENFASLWLMAKGYQILERRCRTPHGEIDLVARRGSVLAFIEVKARARLDAALDALTARQRARLIRARAIYRANNNKLARLQPRFDLILMVPGRWPDHRRGAWQAEGRDAMSLN